MTRALLLSTTALAAVLISGCGNATPPAAQSIADKLAHDSAAGLPAMTAGQLKCVAGVLRSDAKADDLKDYVAGKRSFRDVRTAQNAQAQTGVDDCLKGG